MNMMHVTWDSGLVIASVFIAFLASFSALDTVARVTDSRGMKALLWLVGGGAAMGIGIWSMHFIGMMAMHFTMPMRYNPSETVFSIVVAVLGAIIALWAVFRHNQFTLTNLLLGAIILGTSVVAMHYTGMAGLRINQPIIWQKTPVIISIVIAYSASAVALWLAFRLRNNDAGVLNRRFIAALVMGAAIAGMHYTGMYAAHFDTTMQVIPGGSVHSV